MKVDKQRLLLMALNVMLIQQEAIEFHKGKLCDRWKELMKCLN
jgi:hypothetical protein